jgi:hypothetical protein
VYLWGIKKGTFKTGVGMRYDKILITIDTRFLEPCGGCWLGRGGIHP